MKQLVLIKNRAQLLTIGGILMVCCAVAVIFASLAGADSLGISLIILETAPWLYLAGVVIFSFAQRGLRAPASTLALDRLYTIQSWSHILFLLSAILMIENIYHWLMPLFTGDIESYKIYMQIVYNNWVVFMLIAAVIQLYTVFRIGSELKKIRQSN